MERPGITDEFAGDGHGRLTLSDRPLRLGEQIEFLPLHCDPTTINLYDRFHAMRGDRVEAVWTIATRGRAD